MTALDASVTVAIPVFNGERYLREAIESVLAQSVTPTEILVLDNCSTDRTVEIAGSVLPTSSVRLSPRNVGAVGNFNRAVDESTSTYFAWLAADDRLAPRFVELVTRALEEHPGAPVCLPAIQFIDSDGTPTSVQRDPGLGSTEARTRLRAFLRRPRWTEVYCLYRREALMRSPRFRDEYGADVLLTWWFLLRGPLLVLDDALVEYRTYPVKSVDATAESLNPDAPRIRWLMTTLWWSLWRDTAADGVDARTRRVARSELVRCLWHRHWAHHIAWDFYLVAGDLVRWPRRRARRT